jgi:hypothetical protein
MNNKILKTISVVSAILMIGFFLAAPAILALVDSAWWLAVYLLYVVAYMGDSVGVKYVEDGEE